MAMMASVENRSHSEIERLILLARDMLSSPAESLVVAHLDLAANALRDLDVAEGSVSRRPISPG
jgi:hypothetical protein